jgi:hypothetical protein
MGREDIRIVKRSLLEVEEVARRLKKFAASADGTKYFSPERSFLKLIIENLSNYETNRTVVSARR